MGRVPTKAVQGMSPDHLSHLAATVNQSPCQQGVGLRPMKGWGVKFQAERGDSPLYPLRPLEGLGQKVSQRHSMTITHMGVSQLVALINFTYLGPTL